MEKKRATGQDMRKKEAAPHFYQTGAASLERLARSRHEKKKRPPRIFIKPGRPLSEKP
jgi:hypothetical protein